MVLLQTTVELAVDVFVQFVWIGILAGTLSAGAALVFRWYVREPVPGALALLVGLSGVAIYLNTTAALELAIAGETTLSTELEVALFNITAFLTGVGGALLGRRVGDHFGTDVLLRDVTTNVDEDVGRFVRRAGRVVTVTLPEEIDDVVGYDPVTDRTKEALAGKSFVFPKHITVETLHERLSDRLKSDYAVGTVDLELADDGGVEHLAVGTRPAGISPTLPPATNAVAIRADPAFAASTGDLVQVWEPDSMRRILTAELRGVANDVVTVAIDAGDTSSLDPRREYRLVTLPVDDRPEREFASLLRSAEQTFATVTVEAGSPLHGLPVGALDILVVAVEPEDDTPVVLPDRTYLLAPGDAIAAIALPDTLRRLRAGAEPLDPILVDETPGATEPTAGSVDPKSGEDADTATESHEPTPSDETAVTSQTREDDPTETDDEMSPADESADTRLAGQADASTFRELQAKLNAEDDSPAPETAAEANTDPEHGSSEDTDDMFGDDLDGIDLDSGSEDAVSDSSSLDTGETADDDLSSLDFDDDAVDDDLSSLDFGDDSEDGWDTLGEASFDEAGDETPGDDESEDDEEEQTDGDEDEGDDQAEDDEDDSGSGGASTFAQLKEEFESGDADWEDDISDSPGGDMRLDE